MYEHGNLLGLNDENIRFSIAYCFKYGIEILLFHQKG